MPIFLSEVHLMCYIVYSESQYPNFYINAKALKLYNFVCYAFSS